MTKVVLASHGRLAEGMRDTLGFILGELPNVSSLCAYVDPDVSLGAQVEAVLGGLDETDALIVVTDLFGGSVNNEFMSHLAERDFVLVAGMNMPLLVEMLSADDPSLEEVSAIVERSKSSIMVCNALLSDDAEEDF